MTGFPLNPPSTNHLTKIRARSPQDSLVEEKFVEERCWAVEVSPALARSLAELQTAAPELAARECLTPGQQEEH